AHRREEPDIDAAVGSLAEEVAGQPQRAVPGLLPGYRALLQQGENTVGDDLVGCRTLCCRIHGRNLLMVDSCWMGLKGSMLLPSDCALGTARGVTPASYRSWNTHCWSGVGGV